MFVAERQFLEKDRRTMGRQLRVNLLSPEKQDGIGLIQGARTYIGREPEEGGISLPAQTVSRTHGLFVRLRANWFYKDLGSTNGSWLNGRPANQGEWKLVRSGDVLQLADAAISISEVDDNLSPHSKISGFPALGGITLIVFSKGEFVDEFPVPDFGRALVIGGSQGDLQVEGTLEESPNLIIERRSMNVCAYGISKNLPVQLNEGDLSGSVNLKDRDEIRIGHYYVIFNDPETGHKGLSIVDRGDSSGQSAAWREWSSSDSSPDYKSYDQDELIGSRPVPHGTGIFGRQDTQSGYDETISISPDEAEEQLAGFDRHPSSRYKMEEEASPVSNIANLDEKIIFFIGIVLLLGLIGLMMYWLLG